MEPEDIEALRRSGKLMRDDHGTPKVPVPGDVDGRAGEDAGSPSPDNAQKATTEVPSRNDISLTTRLLTAALALALAVLACLPHWLGPLLAAMTSMVGLPIAWGMRRVTTGASNRLSITMTVAFAATLALAVVAPILWFQAGTLTLPVTSF